MPAFVTCAHLWLHKAMEVHAHACVYLCFLSCVTCGEALLLYLFASNGWVSLCAHYIDYCYFTLCSKWSRIQKIVCGCLHAILWPGSPTWHRGSENQRRKPCLWGWAHCPPPEPSHTAAPERIHPPGSGGEKHTQPHHILYAFCYWWSTQVVSLILEQIPRSKYKPAERV